MYYQIQTDPDRSHRNSQPTRNEAWNDPKLQNPHQQKTNPTQCPMQMYKQVLNNNNIHESQNALRSTKLGKRESKSNITKIYDCGKAGGS